MYTKEQVDEMLSEVENEINIAFETMNKNEEEITTEEIATEEIEAIAEESIEKSEEEVKVEESYETIDDLYASMDKSEQEAHYSALKKSLFTEEESIEETEIKEEVKMDKSEDNKEVDMLKSENEELKKSYEELNSLVEKMFNKGKEAPKAKALTGYDVINKSEDSETKEDKIVSMSKGEITKKLNQIDYSTLSKNDRNSINEYCLENGSVDKIKHLIQE